MSKLLEFYHSGTNKNNLVWYFVLLSSYSNIFVTSPSPENLKTLFEFIFKGFDALDYQV